MLKRSVTSEAISPEQKQNKDDYKSATAKKKNTHNSGHNYSMSLELKQSEFLENIEEPAKEQTEIGFATTTIHHGLESNTLTGEINPSICMSSTFAQRTAGEALNGFQYSRSGNPTRNALERVLAGVEGGNYSCCFGSGSATTASVMQLLTEPSIIISINDVYGGTYRYMTNFSAKIQTHKLKFVEIDGPNGAENLEKMLEQKDDKPIGMVFVESPTNPTLKVTDLNLISQTVKKYNLKHKSKVIFVVDNTLTSPYNSQPLKLGADVVIESITKYINGHSDVIMGVASTNSNDLYKRLKFNQNSIGAVPSPFDCYLVIRGLKTLELRMEKHAYNAERVVKYLEHCRKSGKYVQKLTYPFLRTNNENNYRIAKQQMKTGGGMVTFWIKGGLKESKIFLASTKLFKCAESLGAVESLFEHPAIMTHASVPKKDRKRLGIDDNLIRLSIGVENVNDIINDIKRAFKATFPNNSNFKKIENK